MHGIFFTSEALTRCGKAEPPESLTCNSAQDETTCTRPGNSTDKTVAWDLARAQEPEKPTVSLSLPLCQVVLPF